MNAVIELEDIHISYPAKDGGAALTIVEHYTLGLAAGSMHCLAGRSGSGKTSILRVAAGLVPPSSGQVRWKGQSIIGARDDALTARRRGLLGYLDQGGMLVEGLTAYENVMLPAVPERRTRELAERGRQLLEALGVGQRARSYPGRISGGERQRVALARALLLEPEAVLVDEPTASLDRANADQVIALLRSLADDGIAVLVSAHDQHLIAAADSRTVLE